MKQTRGRGPGRQEARPMGEVNGARRDVTMAETEGRMTTPGGGCRSHGEKYEAANGTGGAREAGRRYRGAPTCRDRGWPSATSFRGDLRRGAGGRGRGGGWLRAR
jgi:hypothetical protein